MTARRAVSRMEPRHGDPRVYSVREIVGELKQLLESGYPSVIVQGEITDCRPPANGHIYFRLKDTGAQLKVAFFANRPRAAGLTLENGISVQVEGEITIYPGRGEMQLVAERIVPVGFGALQARFEVLKKKLQAEGLFAPERKRQLPRYPTHVAIVTSSTGAAVRDVIRVLRQSAPYVRITLVPVRVQGIGAAQEIAGGIALANQWGEAEVLIVGRGGGSLEDLWAFNEEVVVRAIVGSRIPIVSAVGHEVDVTLADLAADLRAATPTHAAQQVAKDKDELCRDLHQLTKHARDRLLRELQRDRRHLQGIRTHRAFREPHRKMDEGAQSLDYARERLVRALEGWVVTRRRTLDRTSDQLHAHAPARTLGRLRERLLGLKARAGRAAEETVARRRAAMTGGRRLLESYDYRGVLRRGYALVWTEGGERLVNRGRALRAEEPIQVQFHDARADARVTRVDAAAEEES